MSARVRNSESQPRSLREANIVSLGSSAYVDSVRWRDRVTIARHELMCAIVVIADILDRRNAVEPDWERLTLALQRLRALLETP